MIWQIAYCRDYISSRKFALHCFFRFSLNLAGDVGIGSSGSLVGGGGGGVVVVVVGCKI
jgi:hypothetical protein